jgi:chitodextrinase
MFDAWRFCQKRISSGLFLTLIFVLALTGAAHAAAPLPPTHLSVKSRTATTISITWKASTSSNIAQYLILRNGVQIAAVAGSALSYTDKGLAPATTYTYSIKTKNTSGQVSAAGY